MSATPEGRQIIFSMVNVSKIHPPQKQVLKDIYISFYYGAKIGVLGLNGSGKSTLLRIMAGQDKDYIGEIHQSPGYSSWLMLEHKDSRFLGPLPDLTEPGAKQAGWWCPDLHLDVRLKATSGPSVMLSFEHAVAVLSHVPFAAINDPVQWLEVALAALPLRPQRRFK